MIFFKSILICFGLLFFTKLPSDATSHPAPRITEKQVKSLKSGDVIFEADMLSYETVYMLKGVVHRITEDQLEKLKLEAYSKAGKFKELMDSNYMNIRVCHVIHLKVTKPISGTVKAGDTRTLILSDHIDSMCPEFGYYEAEFSQKPHLVWMFKWHKTEDGLVKERHAIATVEEYGKLLK